MQKVLKQADDEKDFPLDDIGITDYTSDKPHRQGSVVKRIGERSLENEIWESDRLLYL